MQNNQHSQTFSHSCLAHRSLSIDSGQYETRSRQWLWIGKKGTPKTVLCYFRRRTRGHFASCRRNRLLVL